MSKRLRGGSSPTKEQYYKNHFAKIAEKTSKGKTNKKHKKGRSGR